MSEPRFLEAKAGGIRLMGHVIADFPSAREAREIIAVMVEAGVSVIEIQIPFSEPTADGPVFLAANHAALKAGVTVDDAMTLMGEVTDAHNIPFLFMSYVNVPYRRGWSRFASDAATAGAQGVIVPDLPAEEAEDFDGACTKAGLRPVPVIPPLVREGRLEAQCKRAQGLVYAAARKGVTGAETDFRTGVRDLVGRIRKHTSVPVAVGFGIRAPEDVKTLKGIADYAVVGTRAYQVYQEGGLQELRSFWEQMAEAAKA